LKVAGSRFGFNLVLAGKSSHRGDEGCRALVCAENFAAGRGQLIKQVLSEKQRLHRGLKRTRTAQRFFPLSIGERMTQDHEVDGEGMKSAVEVGSIRSRPNPESSLFQNPAPGLKQDRIAPIKKDEGSHRMNPPEEEKLRRR
jgi:hypothetical protein